MKISELIEKKISSPPEVFLKLRNTMSDPKHTFADLKRIVEADPALAARLLKITNSAFYGLEGKVESIEHALEIVGTQQLTNLVLSATVSDNFNLIPKDLVDMESFWKHSLTCAISAKLLAEMKNKSDTDPYYLAGLLHDIGSLIIYQELPDKAVETLSYCSKTGEHLYWAEDQIIGFNHADMGGALLNDWGLPDNVVEAVKYHHAPLQAKKYPEFCAHIHIAEITAYGTKIGKSGEPQVPPLAPNILEKFNFSQQEVKNIQSEVEGKVEAVFQLFFS